MSRYRPFLLFMLSGGLCTAIDLVFFYALLLVLSKSGAYLLSYALCILLRYFWDARFTFGTARSGEQMLRYLLVNGAVMLIGLGAFHVALPLMPPLWAKLLSIPVTLVSGFALTRLWVFKSGEEQA